MAGERLVEADVASTGLVGDRVVQVYNRDGGVVTARRYPGLLRFRATLGRDGEPVVDGLPWHSPAVTRRVEAVVGRGAHLRKSDGPERFDILPLLVCTDGAVALFGRDVRRLRPNLLIAGVAGATEREWPHTTLRIADAQIGLADLRGRCVMTTYDPDTSVQDPEVLRAIVRQFDGRLCLNAYVIRGGRLAEGDEVSVTSPAHDVAVVDRAPD